MILETLGKLQEVTAQTERHHLAVQRTITELVPWIPFFENPPEQFHEPLFLKTLIALRASLPYNIAFGQVHSHVKRALRHIAILRNLLTEADLVVEAERIPDHLSWNANAGMA